MSLRFAVLGVLSSMPMTGYDMMRYFEESVGTLWPSSPAQTYQELRKMEGEGLIAGTLAPRGRRAEKRIYELTDAGREALELGTLEPYGYPNERDGFRLRFCYFELLPYEVARAHLNAHIAHYKLQIEQLKARIEGIERCRSPLLQARLRLHPPEAHEAIIAYRAQALGAQVLLAQAEITWARRSLHLVAKLESNSGSRKQRKGAA
jgi:PadR family transcriptional regulator AphA